MREFAKVIPLFAHPSKQAAMQVALNVGQARIGCAVHTLTKLLPETGKECLLLPPPRSRSGSLPKTCSPRLGGKETRPLGSETGQARSRLPP